MGNKPALANNRYAFRPKSWITKSELAEEYGITTRTLLRYIQPIMPRLQAVGYQKMQRFLTTAQVQIVRDFLG